MHRTIAQRQNLGAIIPRGCGSGKRETPFSQAPLGPDPPNVGQALLPCRPERVARTTVLAGQWL